MGSNIIPGMQGTKDYVAPEWRMPKTSVGKTVLWSFNRDSDKSPGTVVKVGDRAIELLVHVGSLKDHLVKTGVRHVDDPFLTKFPAHDGGCWQDTPWNLRIEKWLKNFEDAVDVDEP